MEKQKNFEEADQQQNIQYNKASINREHLGQRLFSSKTWIAYCILQILASIGLIVFVAVDLEEQYSTIH